MAVMATLENVLAGGSAAEITRRILQRVKEAGWDGKPSETFDAEDKRTLAYKQIEFCDILAEDERYDEAIEACDRAIRLDPNFAIAHLIRGVALGAVGKPAEAIDALDRAVYLDPDLANADYYRIRGFTLIDVEDYDAAIKAYKFAIAIDPTVASPHVSVGVLFSWSGQYNRAIRAYNRAIHIDPNFALAHTNRGMALVALGRFDEAIRACNRAISIDSTVAQTFFTRGISLASLGRFDEAIQDYKEGLNIDSSESANYSNLGFFLVAVGRFDEAIEACDRAVQIDPENAGAHLNRGIALSKLGRFKETIKAYDSALTIAIQNDEIDIVRNVVKNLISLYDKEIMDEADAIRVLANIYGLQAEDVTKALEELATRAGRETTKRTPVEPSPETMPAAFTPAAPEAAEWLQWPSERWENSPEKAFRKRYAIISYLKRVWNPFIETTGVVVTRDVLKIKDDGAEDALGNYIVNNRNNPKGLERLKDLLILYNTEAREYLADRPIEAIVDTRKIRIPDMC